LASVPLEDKDKLKKALQAVHDSIDTILFGGKRRRRTTKRKGKGKKSRKY